MHLTSEVTLSMFTAKVSSTLLSAWFNLEACISLDRLHTNLSDEYSSLMHLTNADALSCLD